MPYGVYDLIHGKGFVNLGLSSDTAQFAAESIRRWWKAVGAEAFPLAQYLTIFCDGGGSNGYRIHAWKYELAKLADEIGIPIIVHHYPTGCSKFNPVEHRLFNILSMNWAGQAFEDIQTVIRYIHSARTQTGLTVKVRLDQCVYEKGIKIPQDEIDRIIMIEGKRLPSWNYMIVGLAESFRFSGGA